METTARAYFEKFADADLLKGLPLAQVKTFEDEWLDFKSGRPQEGDIARIWSKALGAFANNEGGVLVWGIKAEKDPVTKIDAVSALDLVPNVELLKNRLIEQFRLSTDPPILGVEIIALPLNEIGKEGFVVCYVPEGSTKPYKSLRADKPFYLRIGDEAKEPSLSLLRQLFYPQYSPRLQFTIFPNARRHASPVRQTMRAKDGQMKDAYQHWFNLTLENIGSTTLADGFLRIQSDGMLFYSWTARNAMEIDMEHIKKGSQRLPPVIHPSMRFDLMLICSTLEKIDWFPLELTLFGKDMIPKKAAAIIRRSVSDEVVVEAV